MAQLLLIPDPRPLDERLGRRFFREAPRRAGVYVMRDAADRVLYIGKAKNLHQRLRSYRTANPDRMPRRHLRMVREVARIDFEFCPGESAALKRESKLLRSLKPRFNRAGVWPGSTKFLVWRAAGEQLEIAVADVPETGWQRFGPLGGGAGHLHGTLGRMLWLAVNPMRAFAELPTGWARGRIPGTAVIQCGRAAEQIRMAMDAFFWGDAGEFCLWLGAQFLARTNAFERGVIESEVETLKQFAARQTRTEKDRRQMALL
jgi:predicted GIY-YIG superfamily endonuclease